MSFFWNSCIVKFKSGKGNVAGQYLYSEKNGQMATFSE